MTHAKSNRGSKCQSPQIIDRSERSCLAHRLHEEIEQTLIGISLITRAHVQRLKLEHSAEAKAAARIQRMLERNIVVLDKLIKTLDGGRVR